MLSFRIGSFPVQIEPFYWAMVAILGSSRLRQPDLLIIWALVVTGSILLHELGHALAYRRFGHPSRIQLHGWGGLTQSLGGPPIGPWQQVAISFAGPAAGLALGAVVLTTSRSFDGQGSALLVTLVRDLLWVNIGWSILNLLPIFPLDGGQILEGGLRGFGIRGSQRAVHWLSIAVAGVGAILALRAGMTWAAVLSGFLAVNNFQALMASDEPTLPTGPSPFA